MPIWGTSILYDRRLPKFIIFMENAESSRSTCRRDQLPMFLAHRSWNPGVNRADRIRTCDIQLPKLALYQAELPPVLSSLNCPSQSRPSIKLSYTTDLRISGRRDSNPRPLEPHSSALPSCATARLRRNRRCDLPLKLQAGRQQKIRIAECGLRNVR
jgi:hypothetical protein